MNSKAIRELEAEAHEIITNIHYAAIDGNITWGQRDELLRIVYADVNGQLQLAKGLLDAWKRDDMSSDTLAG
jgi:hypothetical protein